MRADRSGASVLPRPAAAMAPRALRPAPRSAVPAAVMRPASAPSAAQELARRRLVRVVMAIYLLAIFEGSLRKYVLPEFGQYIFFIRDPVLLYAYWIATRAGLWPRHSLPLKISLWLCAFGALLLVLQSAFGAASDLRLLLGVYGWRAYFFYAPLAFLIGAQFRTTDLLRLARITLWLSVPIAVLVAAQFFSPPGAAINVGVAEDAAMQFRDLTIDSAHIRPPGPFSSNVGQQQFVTTALAMLLALMLQPAARRGVGLATLLPAAAAILSCVALGGSRGTLLQCAMIGLFALSVGVLGRGSGLKLRAFAIPLALATTAVLLYPVVFPEGFAAFVQRWNVAAHDESAFEGGVFGRALFGFVDFLRLVDIVPPLGFGLGFGGNASTILKASVDGVMPGQLAETDYARQMVDLGVVCGLAYIGLRVALVAWLGRQVLRATRRSAATMPMLLFGYAGYVVLLGQITGNGSINVYAWLFSGLCIAATREALAGAQRRPAPVAARVQARGPR